MTDEDFSCTSPELREIQDRMAKAIDDWVAATGPAGMVVNWVVAFGIQAPGECMEHPNEHVGYVSSDSTTDWAIVGLLSMTDEMVRSGFGSRD